VPVHFRISIKKAQNLDFFDLTIFLLRARLSGKANMNDNRKFSKNSDGSHDFGGECSADDMILQNAGEDFGFDDIESDDEKCEFENAMELGELPEKVYSIVLDYCRECHYAASADEAVCFKRGDFVVAKTRYGADVVRIAGDFVRCPEHIKHKDLICIKRLATDAEVARFYENKERVCAANKIFKQKVLDNDLKMHLIASHFLSAEPKVLFFFTAESRIDFRKLVKDLVAVFKLRVELRQIAVRDESRIIGGLGQCGRAFCCCCMGDKMPTVSTKKARDQGVSLLTQKSSGPCGRLLCCLSFEHEWYAKERPKFPPIGFRFCIDDKDFVVTDINMVMGYVIASDAQSRSIKFPVHHFYNENGTWKIDEAFLAEYR
jgi:tpl protein